MNRVYIAKMALRVARPVVLDESIAKLTRQIE